MSPGTQAQFTYGGGARPRKNTFSKTSEDLEEDLEDSLTEQGHDGERRDSYEAIVNGRTSMDATERGN